MKSIKILIAIAAISVVGIQQSHGQEDELPSAESIMNKFVEATGGIDKYKAVKSMVGEGTLSIPAAGLNGTLKLAMETSGKLKVEAEIPGAGSESGGCDGTHCWSNSMTMGPRLLTGAEADEMKEQGSMKRIYDAANYYKSMKTVGIENVGDEKCYKVVLTKKGGKEVTSFYSVESGLEVMSSQTQDTAMGKIKIETHASDYREVDGLKSAFKVEQKFPNGMSQIISFDKVEYNVDIDAATFEIPAEIQKLVDKKAEKEKAGAGGGK